MILLKRELIKAAIFLLGIGAVFIQTAALGVSAQSAALLDADTGKIIWSKNADKRLPMASTTKIMTALLALETSDPDDIVTVKPEHTRVEGSSMYLRPGERLSMRELLFGLMLSSGNDAALAIAEHCGGSVDRFVGMMNAEAVRLGLKDTSFETPNGLDGPKHYTTAAELGKITAKALESSEFREIASSKVYTGSGRSLRNHNRLLWSLEGCIGVKTGFTRRSGRCLVSAAERDGTMLLAVTLNAPDDWDDHKKMLEYGFDTVKTVMLCDAGAEFEKVPVVSGTSGSVSVHPAESLRLLLPKEKADRVRCRAYLPGFLYAPLFEGQAVGRLRFDVDGEPVGEMPLVLSGDVPEIELPEPGLLEKLKDFFGQFSLSF